MTDLGRNPILLLLFLLFFLSLTIPLHAKNYEPSDVILLNCGSNSNSPDTDGRKWTPDIGSKFTLSSSKSTVSTADTQASTVTEIPFMTARIFESEFTYTIPVVPGQKLLRLYFYPNTYSTYNTSTSFFSVNVGTAITLLSNFSAYQTALALNFDYITKEYIIDVESSPLTLTFTPSTKFPNSFAFVNGIEVVSMPGIYNSPVTGVDIVGQDSTLVIDNTTALENLYRLNVGGNMISSIQDTGMFRTWSIDSPYLFGAAAGVTPVLDPGLNITYPIDMESYIAPVDMYSTARTMGPDFHVNENYNLTWFFSVDSGFKYLVRLHFCEVSANITKQNQRVFDIYLNNQTAFSEADVIAWANGNGIPFYKDFVVLVPDGDSPQQDLWLALHPHTQSKPQYYDSILNGVEIFKVSDSKGSLAGMNPVPLPEPNVEDNGGGEPSSSKSGMSIGVIGGGVGGGLALLLVIGLIGCCVVCRRRKSGKFTGPSDGSSGWLPLPLYGNSHSSGSKTTTTGSIASSLPANICRHFSFSEIKTATKNFDESLVLGVGGFGKVYRGIVDNGTLKVAVKRGNPLSEQGIHEFQTEIEMLSKLRHRHLVSLLGYCEDNGEMILVYDYMAFGTLREHLYKTQKPPMPWRQRLEICIGAARGLHYLHTGAKYTIIHRDVKTTNILLDEKFVAKVSDFGLSKTGPNLDHTHVSTVVKGSFGYLDPEYFRRQQLTDKSDVYSFGVVLFEVLCARPALNPTLAKEQVALAEWAAHCTKKGMLDQIMDPFLKGKIAPECFKKFAETAMKCVADQGIERPSMGDVLWNLEFALQLQESAEECGGGKGGIKVGMEEFGEGNYDVELGKGGGKKDVDADVYDGNMTDSRTTVASEDSDGLTPSTVFSQIMNPKGR